MLERLREKLNELRAMGMPLPDDLVALEKRLEERFPKTPPDAAVDNAAAAPATRLSRSA